MLRRYGRILGSELVSDLAGPIGGIIIDNEHFNFHGQRKNSLRQRRKVLPLIKSWYNDNRSIHGIDARKEISQALGGNKLGVS